MKYFLFILFPLLIVLSSCNKNEKKSITSDLLNFFYKTGTYWVYIDTISNNIDSVYLVDYDHYIRDHYVTDYTSYDVEYYIFTTESSPSLESVDFEISEKSIHKEKTGTHSYTTFYVDYNDVVNWDGYIFEHLDSTFIYDRYYYRVLKVEVTEDGNEDDNKSIYYSNSEYGILRQDIYNDTVLASQKILMRKNIVR